MATVRDKVLSPHRPGFSIIENVEEIDAPNFRIVASFHHTKETMLSLDDHRPQIFPGVILIEAACQALYPLVSELPELSNKVFVLAKVSEFSFSNPIQYNQEVFIECNISKIANDYVVSTTTAKVGDKEVGKGKLIFWALERKR